MTEKTGRISSCVEVSAICGYRCCDQDIPNGNEPVRPVDYIMMYPGEYDVNDPTQEHLEPIGEHNGGILARCTRECFDQAGCHPDRNYKPLDCRSYPLMPEVLEGGVLALMRDARCPLTLHDIPPEHCAAMLQEWREVASDPDVLGWLSRLVLEGYEAQ